MLRITPPLLAVFEFFANFRVTNLKPFSGKTRQNVKNFFFKI